jgi:hypothetical protein
MVIDMIGVDVDPSRIIRQDIISRGGACGPATFLNALRFGPTAFQNAYSALPGNSDSEKLANIVSDHGSVPSASMPGQSLFASNGGVFADDANTYFNSILAGHSEPMSWTYFDVAPNEAPSQHLRRVHRILASSLEQGVPVITSVHSFAARKQNDDTFSWNRIGGHFILVFAVPGQLNEGASGFIFQFVDPNVSKPCEGYIYSEIVRPFVAAKESCAGYILNTATNHFEPLKGSRETKWIENGFLHVVSPSLWLKTQGEPWHARTFLVLNFGLGKFPSGTDSAEEINPPHHNP